MIWGFYGYVDFFNASLLLSWMFEHDCLDTCCCGCLIRTCFIFCNCTCLAHLSVVHMERQPRNTIIIITVLSSSGAGRVYALCSSACLLTYTLSYPLTPLFSAFHCSLFPLSFCFTGSFNCIFLLPSSTSNITISWNMTTHMVTRQFTKVLPVQ